MRTKPLTDFPPPPPPTSEYNPVRARLEEGCTVISLASEGGGSGKTTSVANLAVVAAEEGLKVLVIDGTPLGDCTYLFGFDAQTTDSSILSVMEGRKPEVKETVFPNLHLLPGGRPLREREYQRLSGEAPRFTQNPFSLTLEQLRGYDLVLIDTPTGTDEEGIAASEIVFAPFSPGRPLLRCVDEIQSRIERIAKGLQQIEGAPLYPRFGGAFLTQLKTSAGVIQHDEMKAPRMATFILHQEDFQRATFAKVPVLEAASIDSFTTDYEGLWKEMKGVLEATKL